MVELDANTIASLGPQPNVTGQTQDTEVASRSQRASDDGHTQCLIARCCNDRQYIMYLASTRLTLVIQGPRRAEIKESAWWKLWMLWLQLELTCTEGRQGTTRPVPTSAHIMHTYDNTKMQSESGSMQEVR